MKDNLLKFQIFLDRSKLRKIILESLIEKEQVAIFLAKKLKKHRSAISRTLGELKDNGLVECINPEDSNYKIYKITDFGKEILNLKN